VLNYVLFSIIDRIKRGRSDDIILIVPGGLPALRSIINLRILKEEAISLGKNISIVSSDSLIKKLAQQANLVVLESAKEPRPSSQGEDVEDEDRWPGKLRIEPRNMPVLTRRGELKKRIISDIMKPRKEGRIEEPTEEEEPFFAEATEDREQKEEPIFVESQKPKPSFRFFTKKRLIVAAVVIFLIVGGFVLYFILPNAQIVIIPKKETIRFETEIVADKNIDSISFIDSSIPGQVFQLEMEDSRKFPTTGEKEVEEKARGTIVVYNQYSSSPQTLVETTRFLSETGKLFRLVETTVIPGAIIEEGKIVPSSKEIEVAADEPGESYNIGPSNFTIPGFKGSPKYTGFSAQSVEPMTGGAKGKIRVATKEDIEGATEIVSLELKDEIKKQFNKKISKELKLLEDSQILEITELSSSLKANEPGKEFLITVKAKAWGLAFKENDIFYLTEKNIGDKISENKILIPSTIKIDYTNTEIDLDQGRATFSCQIQADAAWKLDKEKVRDNLAGKDEVGVRKYLSSLSEIETAKVVFWPFWVNKIPKNKDKIKIIIDTNI